MVSIPAPANVDRYRVLSALGSGGMGTVSAAFDNVRGHEVALKRLLAERISTRGEKRRAIALFEREFFTLTELSHPRIVSVYDYGIDDHGPYYTMELLPGENLRARAPVAVETACALLRDVASALAIIHSRRLVHRDVTHLNVRCTPDGRAKLIDFGAMVPVGTCKDVVGTPPFVAPECLELTTLDARTDLYAVGACLYYALTGRHAYPARQMRQLRELWRTPAIAPSRWVPDIPESLDRLVLALLNLQPSGRPSSAAEVFERLTTIGKLEKGEEAETARAYFTSPALVGRDGPLSTIRARLLSATRGRGASVCVEGPPGVGRSRLLDAVALEARLLGLGVARADALDAQSGPFGVARRLVDVVLEAQPDLASALTTLELSDVAPGRSLAQKTFTESRERLIEGICELLCGAAKSRGWAFVVDDLHLIDEPSFAVIASLSTHARSRRFALVTSIDAEARASVPSAMLLLAESSRRVTLSALDEAGSRALLASLTGEVPHLDTLNAIVFASCAGSPSRTIEAARALSEGGLLRYQSGTWLVEGDPAVIEAALLSLHQEHLGRLSADADELLAILALDRDRLLALADYPSATSHRSPSRVHRALDELVRAGLLSPLGDRHRFTRDAVRAQVLLGLDDARRRAIHLRLAEATVGLTESPVYTAYHFLEGGEPSRAMPYLIELREYVDRSPASQQNRSPVLLDALERIATLSDDEIILHRLGLEHSAALVIAALYQGVPERGVIHARLALERLSFMSGLADYHAHPELDEQSRLALALAAANERCGGPLAAPGFEPAQCIQRLCQLTIVTAVCARFMADVSLLDALPDLRPFAVLSPAIGLTTRLANAMAKAVRGQDWAAWDALGDLYGDLCGPSGEELEPLTRAALNITVLGFLCAYEAEHATESALRYIDTYSPNMPNLAESHRARFHLSHGDLSASNHARRRFELLSVRASGLAEARLTELPSHLTLYTLSDDVLGLERTVDAIERVVRARPCWRPRLLLGRAHLLRARGEIDIALRVVEGALTELGNLDPAWPALSALHLDLLNRVRRPYDAVRIGRDYVAHAIAQDFPTALLQLALAEAHAECDEPDDAERCFESARGSLESRGARGLPLGHCFEMGARIALRGGDRAEFSARLKTCASLYRRGHNPALTARYDALVREAAHDNPDFDGPTRLATASSSERPLVEATQTVVDGGDRYLELLRRFSTEAGARGAVLYVNTAMGLVRRHATLGLVIPPELDEEVGRYFGSGVPPDATPSPPSASDGVFGRGHASITPATGRWPTLDIAPLSGTTLDRFEPFILEFASDGHRLITGVLVFALSAEDRLKPRADALSAIAAQIAALPSVEALRAGPILETPER